MICRIISSIVFCILPFFLFSGNTINSYKLSELPENWNIEKAKKVLKRYKFIKGNEIMGVYLFEFKDEGYIQQVIGLDGTEAVRVNGTYTIDLNGKNPKIILHPERIQKSHEYNIFEEPDVNEFVYDYTKYVLKKASDEVTNEFINSGEISDFDKPLYFLEDPVYSNEFYYYSIKIPNQREQDSIDARLAGPSSINSNTYRELSVYPNPASDVIYLKNITSIDEAPAQYSRSNFLAVITIYNCRSRPVSLFFVYPSLNNLKGISA